MAPKFIPFEDVEELADIEQLASMLNLQLIPGKTQLRCICPVHGGDERTLCISPGVRSRRGSLGVFYCQKDQTGGDRIGLVAHCMELGQQEAALFIQSQFGTGTVNSTVTSTVTVSKERATSPQAARGEPTPPPKFDPAKFAEKLVFSAEVQALGISEDTATMLGVGWHPQRKAVYFPMRHVDGQVSGKMCIRDSAARLLPVRTASRYRSPLSLNRAMKPTH